MEQTYDVTIALYALADWLQTCGIDTVAMESTGIYWISIYEILKERGFKVFLVNARQIKNVSGRKTDILDSQWIQQLGSSRETILPPALAGSPDPGQAKWEVLHSGTP